MPQMYRINPSGREYQFQGDDEKTAITTGQTSITVPFTVEVISQAWYNWSQKGQFIQDAFSFLTPNQREFLMTGITADEWDRMFPSEKV